MRFVTVIAAGVLVLAAPAGANAAGKVKRCPGVNEAGSDSWIFDGSASGASNGNVRARNVTCRTARRFIVRFNWRPRHGSYSCTFRYPRFEATEVTCKASGGRLVRWISAA